MPTSARHLTCLTLLGKGFRQISQINAALDIGHIKMLEAPT